MPTKFSKIEICDRLRRLDLWEDGSLLKDQIKQRLMAGGLSRKAANEEAWDQIARHYEIEYVECHDAARIASLANFGPSFDEELADQPGEPLFDLIWTLWCFIQAKQQCLESRSEEAIEAIDARIAQAGADAGDAETAKIARDDVGGFIQGLAVPKLLAVITRLETTGDADYDDIEELLELVDEMGKFSEVVAGGI